MVDAGQRKTFLSYSRANKDFAIKLAKELKAEGFSIWLDQLDIPAGARWDREVEKALKECEIFMIILTPASVDSENVLDEIGYAIDTGKRFLPVFLEPCDVPLRLRRFQYVDFTTKSFNEGVESAKDLLRGLIAQITIPRTEFPAEPQSQIAQAEADRKAKEDADRLAAQKAEAARLAVQKAEAERLAQAKAESERKAKEESDRLAAQKAKVKTVDAKVENVSAPAMRKKPVSKGLVIGIVAVVVLVIAGIGFGALSHRGTPATEAPIVSASATKAKPANTPKPSNIPSTPTQIPGPIFLDTSDAAIIVENGNGKGIFAIAREQNSEDELNGFFDSSLPIPLMLDNPGPILVGFTNIACATTKDILQENLSYFEIVYKLEDKIASEKNVVDEYHTNTEGLECFDRFVVIDKWTSGEYFVYQEVTLTQKINDGKVDIDPNTDSISYIVTVP